MVQRKNRLLLFTAHRIHIYIYIHIIVLTMFMVILAVIEDQKCPEHSICVRYYVAVVALLKIKEQYVSDRNISQ